MIKKIIDKVFVTKQKLFLLKEKNKLIKDLDRVKKFPQFGNSEEDNAQEMGEFEENKGMETNIKSHLKQVMKALDKIDKGEYNICDSCKGKIELGRLNAFPAANLCVSCAGKKK